MHTKLKTKLETLLRTNQARLDARLWDRETGVLNQTMLVKLAEETDPELVALLLADEGLRKKFFVEVGGVVVFKRDEFRFFIEENKIDNSYTDYKNRIGLSDGRRFLHESGEVVLSWPYKDCVLEGGQSTEEGKETYFEKNKGGGYKEKRGKRKEIFFNEVLAADEIDRLTEEKALVNWQRFSVENTGPRSVQKINRDENGLIKENLIIKGNNLLALHSLRRQFAGRVKLIYIDPPYNTGNDGFKYNDKFNHSTWLTFMKNRLEVARELLREDGVIFVQCDDNEQAYLKVLMDEVFGRGNFVNNFIWISNLKGRQISNYGAAKTHEFILCYGKKSNYLNTFKIEIDKIKKLMPSVYKGFDYETKKDNIGEYVIKNQLYNTNSIFNEETRPSLVFNIHYNFHSKEVKFSEVNTSIEYEGFTKINPIKNNDGTHKYRAWRWSRGKIKNELHNLEFLKNGKIYTKVRDFKATTVKDIIADIKVNGNGELKQLIDYGVFNFPKPEALLYLLIVMTTKKDDLVLDYHLGSGTTAAVAHKMGRQYIGIEQMDYIQSVAVERLKKVIAGEPGGISKSVGWQGGGSFIYCELAKWNEKAKEEIQNKKSLEELKVFFKEMEKKYFLNYNLKIKEFEEVIKEKEFINLSLEEQKRMFITMLDNNQLYVNRSEMEDSQFKTVITPTDLETTREFYGVKE